MTDAPKTTRPLSKWFNLLLAISGVVLMMLFDHFGASQYAYISFISIVALSFAVWENRSYHKEIWYWFMLLVFTGAHLLLVMVVGEHKWLTSAGHGTGGGVAFLAILDGLVITAFIRFPDWVTSSLKYIYGDSPEVFGDSQERTFGR